MFTGYGQRRLGLLGRVSIKYNGYQERDHTHFRTSLLSPSRTLSVFLDLDGSFEFRDGIEAFYPGTLGQAFLRR